MLNAAIHYAELGFQVVPLWPAGKTPLPFRGARNPTRDVRKIIYWWELCPKANIGLPTGVDFNSLIVIDLDIEPSTGIDGQHQLQQILVANGIRLPETGVARTGSGGLHYYFNNKNRILLHGKRNYYPGIDVRAEGAHVVAPPSIHSNGNRYEWIQRDAADIADCTDDVYHLLQLLQSRNME